MDQSSIQTEFPYTKCWLMIHNWKIQLVTYLRWPPGTYGYQDGFHEFRMWPDDNRVTLVKPDDFEEAKARFEQWVSE